MNCAYNKHRAALTLYVTEPSERRHRVIVNLPVTWAEVSQLPFLVCE